MDSMGYNPSKLWVDVTGRVECLGGLVTMLKQMLKNITELGGERSNYNKCGSSGIMEF